MTDYQNELVMEHLDLVNWVIRTRISVPNRPLLTYDDFYAIGCEAICRAALKYQADSGEFAPFACRYGRELVSFRGMDLSRWETIAEVSDWSIRFELSKKSYSMYLFEIDTVSFENAGQP